MPHSWCLQVRHYQLKTESPNYGSVPGLILILWCTCRCKLPVEDIGCRHPRPVQPCVKLAKGQVEGSQAVNISPRQRGRVESCCPRVDMSTQFLHKVEFSPSFYTRYFIRIFAGCTLILHTSSEWMNLQSQNKSRRHRTRSRSITTRILGPQKIPT